MNITIEDGHVKFIYSDELAEALASLMDGATVTRASHVEPHPFGGGWLADMAPSGGPVLGDGVSALRPHHDCDCHQCDHAVVDLPPFKTRQAALEAEHAWLVRERGL